MKRLGVYLLALVLSTPAGAQTRIAVPAAGGVSVPVSPIAASPLSVTPLTGSPLTAAPSLAVPSAAPAPLAAPSAVAVPVAVVAAPAPAPAPALTPAKPSALSAASALVPAEHESRASGERKAAAAFDGGRPLNILMAGAEAVPFVKTGGLADVVDAVARGMAERGHKVLMVLPKYRILNLKGVDLKPAGSISVPMGDRVETAQLMTAKVSGVDVVLIDHKEYYDRSGGPYAGKSSMYGDDDNDERFGFYARASLEAARALGFRPDVAHAHDWHAALIPAFLKLTYAADPFFAATRSIVTIHNLAFQGVYAKDVATKLGFTDAAAAGPLAYHGGISYLKAGLTLADAVTTVSPTYAKEIRAGPEFGMGLEDTLNARPDGVHGILNGLDPELNDPRTDPTITRNYGVEDAAQAKAENKEWIQKHRGLDQDPSAPLFVVASRLAGQKGIDLVLQSVNEIVARGGQVLVTGSGDRDLEEALAAAEKRHPGKVASHPFDSVFVQAVYAAADFLLMPSRFEPCGLSQLIAHRYGTLPIVNPTGGLADTVRDLRADALRGDGIVMREFSILGLVEAVEAAIAGYRNPEALRVARATAMTNDSSWGPALDAYEALYRGLIGDASANRAAKPAP